MASAAAALACPGPDTTLHAAAAKHQHHRQRSLHLQALLQLLPACLDRMHALDMTPSCMQLQPCASATGHERCACRLLQLLPACLDRLQAMNLTSPCMQLPNGTDPTTLPPQHFLMLHLQALLHLVPACSDRLWT